MRLYHCKTLRLKTADGDLCQKNAAAGRSECVGCTTYLDPLDEEVPEMTPPPKPNAEWLAKMVAARQAREAKANASMPKPAAKQPSEPAPVEAPAAQPACRGKCGRTDAPLNKRGWCSSCWRDAHQKSGKPKKQVYEPPLDELFEPPLPGTRLFVEPPKTKEPETPPSSELDLTFRLVHRDAILLDGLLNEVERYPHHSKICAAMIGEILVRAKRL